MGDKWRGLYSRLEAARNAVAGRGRWEPDAVRAANRLADRWWGWWDRTHGDGRPDGEHGYRVANGLFGA